MPRGTEIYLFSTWIREPWDSRVGFDFVVVQLGLGLYRTLVVSVSASQPAAAYTAWASCSDYTTTLGM